MFFKNLFFTVHFYYIAILCVKCHNKLVLNSQEFTHLFDAPISDEALYYLQVDKIGIYNLNINVELMKKESAEIVNKSFVDHSCKWVRQEETVWRVEVQQDGEKIAHHVTTRRVLDQEYETIHITNAQEPWIQFDLKVRPYLNCFDQENAHLVSLVQSSEYSLAAPSSEQYNITGLIGFGQHSQAKFLDMVVFQENVLDGFFIEAGADDFVTDSNTLFFEVARGWTGLLVEPNPIIYPKGLTAQRKAWSTPHCLATQPKAHFTSFSTQSPVEGGMAGMVADFAEDSFVTQCIPLYTLLLAVGERGNTVNYLSLDIEGVEFQVLQTIPWEKVDIEVLTVEMNHAGELSDGGESDIRNYLAQKGYVYFHTVGLDDVFIRKDLFEGKYKPDMSKIDEFYKVTRQNCKVMNSMEVFLSIVEDFIEKKTTAIVIQCPIPIALQ